MLIKEDSFVFINSYLGEAVKKPSGSILNTCTFLRFFSNNFLLKKKLPRKKYAQ